MEEEDRSLDPISAAEFDRETEEMLSTAGVDIGIGDNPDQNPNTSDLVEEALDNIVETGEIFESNDLISDLTDVNKSSKFVEIPPSDNVEVKDIEEKEEKDKEEGIGDMDSNLEEETQISAERPNISAEETDTIQSKSDSDEKVEEQLVETNDPNADKKTVDIPETNEVMETDEAIPMDSSEASREVEDAVIESSEKTSDTTATSNSQQPSNDDASLMETDEIEPEQDKTTEVATEPIENDNGESTPEDIESSKDEEVKDKPIAVDGESNKTDDSSSGGGAIDTINEDDKKNADDSVSGEKCDNQKPLQSSEIDTSCCTNDETEFVQVNTKHDKISSTENESQYDIADVITDEDPIGGTESIEFENGEQHSDDEEETTKGVDEEICIIPDTERIISQAEKEAALNKNDVIDISADDSNEKQKNSAEKTKVGDDATSTDTATAPTITSVDASDSLAKPAAPSVVNLDEPHETTCKRCDKESKCLFKVTHLDVVSYICSDDCLSPFLKKIEPTPVDSEGKKPQLKCKTFRSIVANREPLVFQRKCSACQKKIIPERALNWECMEFCNEECLGTFQNNVGGNCASCQQPVAVSSLGKYCVRFGYDIRQFCTSSCLEEFKKGLKVCSYCQKDISKGDDGFLAPVGDKGQFKDFCTQTCMRKFEQMGVNQPQEKPHLVCSVCNNKKAVRLEIVVGGEEFQLCSEPCFVAFKFANNVSPEQCRLCQKYFEQTTLDTTLFFDDEVHTFCSRTCQNVYIIASRKIVPCQWCKVKKYNFDMIKKKGINKQMLMMCSLNCMTLYQDSLNTVNCRGTKCDYCSNFNLIQYHLAMSDASIRNFCSYNCVMYFQKNFQKMPLTIIDKPIKAVPMGVPKKTYMVRETRSSSVSPASPKTNNDVSNLANSAGAKGMAMMPIITNVHSLAHTNGATNATRNATKSVSTSNYSKAVNNTAPAVSSTTQNTTPIVIQQILSKPLLPTYKNKLTMCKPNTHTKGVLFRPHTTVKETQTEETNSTVIMPVPVPIYIPVPMAMYSIPVPVPVPFPLPVPIPIFIPTTRNSANGIMKEIKKIQVKIPTDPFEAELLMMAEMVAGEKKIENTDSESEEDEPGGNDAAVGDFSPEAVVDTSNAFGDDMLQMALKMATELDEPAVDLEGALTANTITANQSHDGTTAEEVVDESQALPHIHSRGTPPRQRKRPGRPPRSASGAGKRRRMSGSELPLITPSQPPQPAIATEPIEKPDANMCLKYTFGVNAWKQWVTTKNAELEKSTLRVKPFKSEILQLTSDELNYSLCLFVKEVRKPNGSEYAPDTIYYLCLGIQQYLFENGRIDNIFTDAFYEKFTDCLDEVARKFSVLYNDSHYIVTRVEEEHLWESKQLGAHSPHVLLSTLMFFNTKHFNLTTVDEHMQLSFTHIMKHWKRNPNQPGASKQPGSRNVLLRFYPPQAAVDANARKKKVYEQQENEDNPLRCPVKLYEFYLSKCPESVKIRNDVFYLLPERSCVPDSPVWYSTMPLGRAALEKMLHRVKMVKEINVALLTS